MAMLALILAGALAQETPPPVAAPTAAPTAAQAASDDQTAPDVDTGVGNPWRTAPAQGRAQ